MLPLQTDRQTLQPWEISTEYGKKESDNFANYNKSKNSLPSENCNLVAQ